MEAPETKTQPQNQATSNTFTRLKNFWHTLGPGLTTGAADDDPSGIATYSQAGAKYGFNMLWLALFTFPFMLVVQEMCARIGIVTGRGLAANIRLHFPKWVLYSCTALLFAANTFNIGADLGAMAKAVQIISPNIPTGVLVIGFTALSLVLQIWIPYKKYAGILKWLALILLSYVVTGLIVNLNWSEVFKHTIIPSINFSKDTLFLITAIIGTTISPYLFFWQTAQEVEEEIAAGKTTIASRRHTEDTDITNMRIDVTSGMFISNLVMFFIIAVCGAVLHTAGITEITSAEQAAKALEPLAGPMAGTLFTLGIIGTGLLAIPVLAGSASYAIAESLKWKEGLYRPYRGAQAFYGVIIVSTLIGLLLNFTNLDPIKTLIYSAAANGIIAPIIMVLVVLLASNKKVMGKFSNSKLSNLLGWIITLLMIFTGIATLYILIF